MYKINLIWKQISFLHNHPHHHHKQISDRILQLTQDIVSEWSTMSQWIKFPKYYTRRSSGIDITFLSFPACICVDPFRMCQLWSCVNHKIIAWFISFCIGTDGLCRQKCYFNCTFVLSGLQFYTYSMASGFSALLNGKDTFFFWLLRSCTITRLWMWMWMWFASMNFGCRKGGEFNTWFAYEWILKI